MNVAVYDHEHQDYIRRQLDAGRFASAEQMVAAAIHLLLQADPPAATDDEIDDATAGRLADAHGRAVRGEGGLTIEQARDRLRRPEGAAERTREHPAAEDFDDETAAALNESFADAAAGRVMTVEEAAERLGTKLTRRPS